MSSNTFANVVSGAGGVVEAGPGTLACEAFEAAVKNFCRDKPLRARSKPTYDPVTAKRRGRFNDYFYRSLSARNSQLSRSIQRERADVFRRVRRGGSTYGRHAGSAADLARRTSGNRTARAMGAIANNAFNAARRKGRSVDAARGAAAMLTRNRLGKTNYYLRFQDGTLPDGSNIELKGPADSERDGQFADGKKAAGNKTLIVVSCESCGVPCEKGCK